MVPGTGDDPVTSCFSDTHEEMINGVCEASGRAESQMTASSLGAFMRPKIGPNISKYISTLLAVDYLLTKREVSTKPLTVQCVFWHHYAILSYAVSGRIPLHNGLLGYIRGNIPPQLAPFLRGSRTSACTLERRLVPSVWVYLTLSANVCRLLITLSPGRSPRLRLPCGRSTRRGL